LNRCFVVVVLSSWPISWSPIEAPAISAKKSVFFLFFQFFDLAPLALKLGLIGVDLALLVGLLLFLSLQLVADQRAGAKAKGTADSGADARRSHGGANNTAHRRPPEGADSRAFLARGQ
jgi:hypothetical protein